MTQKVYKMSLSYDTLQITIHAINKTKNHIYQTEGNEKKKVNARNRTGQSYFVHMIMKISNIKRILQFCFLSQRRPE